MRRVAVPALVAACLACLLWTPPGHAQAPATGPAAGSSAPGSLNEAAVEALEIEAKRLFDTRRYRASIAVLERLQSSTGHPAYFGNIGRCYQALKESDRALTYFRRYLREDREIPPAKRTEVEGFIREIEAQKQKLQADERAANQAKADGRHGEAAELFKKLHDGTGKARHLRDAAREYQSAGQKELALAHYRRYLSESRGVTAAERKEIETAIASLEAAPASAAGSAAAAAAPTPISSAPGAVTAAAPVPAGAHDQPAGVDPRSPAGVPTAGTPQGGSLPLAPLRAQAADDVAGRPAPRRVPLIVALVGGAVFAGGLAVLGKSWYDYSSARDEGCGEAIDCKGKASSVDTQGKVALALMGTGLVVGGVGLVLYYLPTWRQGPEAASRGRDSGQGLTLAVSGRF